LGSAAHRFLVFVAQFNAFLATKVCEMEFCMRIIGGWWVDEFQYWGFEPLGPHKVGAYGQVCPVRSSGSSRAL